MENTLNKYRIQTQLNKQLRILIEKEKFEAIGEIVKLLQNGADPNHRPKYSHSLICTVLYSWPRESVAAGVKLLTSFGANVNLPDGSGHPAYSVCLKNNYPVEILNLLLTKGAVPIKNSIKDFEFSDVSVRDGRTNPEKVTDAFYAHMVATGARATKAGKSRYNVTSKKNKIKYYKKEFEELTKKAKAGKLSGELAVGFFKYMARGYPKWCNNRFGSSFHFLEDGTMIQIGGEHEDFYDPDFNIYNDVIKITPSGGVELFLYPKHIFPPTDFHSSTKFVNKIIIIGGLGYQKDRLTGQTNMFVLNLDDFSIKSLSSSGDKPGWIFEHTALLDEHNNSLYLMDGEKWIDGKSVKNKTTYRFDLKKNKWKSMK